MRATLLTMAIVFAASSVAADLPVTSVQLVGPSPVGQFTAVPGMGGPTLASQGLAITIEVVDQNGFPVPGYPFQDLYLHDLAGDFYPCPGGSVADANTNASGQTTISGSMIGGGFSTEVWVYAAGVAEAVTQLTVTSPDFDRSHDVGLEDVGHFAAKFATPALDFEIDLNGDGLENMIDIGLFATYVGAACN